MIAGHWNGERWIDSGSTASEPAKPPPPKRLHELKIKDDFIHPVISGEKKAEVRKNDRDYQAGDYLLLTSGEGTRCLVLVTHVLHDYDFKELPEGFCVLSIERIFSR